MWFVECEVITRSGSIISQDIQHILQEIGDRLRVLSGTTLLGTGANGFLYSYFVATIAALNKMELDIPSCVIAVDKMKSGFFQEAHLS